MPADTAALPRLRSSDASRSTSDTSRSTSDAPWSPRPANPRPATASRTPIPSAATLAAAALGRRTALAEVLTYAHAFATAYCRAALGPDPIVHHLPAQISTAIATGWPAARTARRDFLEFAYTTAHQAVRVCRYELSHPRLLGPLTENQREILTLRVLLGFSPLETSVALGIPILDIHRETTRALTRLRPRVAVQPADIPACGPARLDQRTRGINSTRGIRRVLRRW